MTSRRSGPRLDRLSNTSRRRFHGCIIIIIIYTVNNVSLLPTNTVQRHTYYSALTLGRVAPHAAPHVERHSSVYLFTGTN